MRNQTKTFLAISTFLVGVAFIGTGIFEGMILEEIGQTVQIILGILFVVVGFVIIFSMRSSRK